MGTFWGHRLKGLVVGWRRFPQRLLRKLVEPLLAKTPRSMMTRPGRGTHTVLVGQASRASWASCEANLLKMVTTMLMMRLTMTMVEPSLQGRRCF